MVEPSTGGGGAARPRGGRYRGPRSGPRGKESRRPRPGPDGPGTPCGGCLIFRDLLRMGDVWHMYLLSACIVESISPSLPFQLHPDSCTSTHIHTNIHIPRGPPTTLTHPAIKPHPPITTRPSTHTSTRAHVRVVFALIISCPNIPAPLPYRTARSCWGTCTASIPPRPSGCCWTLPRTLPPPQLMRRRRWGTGRWLRRTPRRQRGLSTLLSRTAKGWFCLGGGCWQVPTDSQRNHPQPRLFVASKGAVSLVPEPISLSCVADRT